VTATILLAYLGFSYWSLVYGSLIAALIEPILFWRVRPLKLSFKFDKQIARELFDFGKFILINTYITFIFLNIDNVIAGKILGPTVLGYYMLAFKFGNYSTTLVTHATGRIIYSTFSKIQDDPERLTKAYLMNLKYVSLLSIPIAFGTFAIAEEFIKVVIGEKWLPAVIPLQILCFYGLFRSLTAGSGTIFASVGKPDIITKYQGAVLAVCLIFIYPITIWLGLAGLAALMTICMLISLIWQIIMVDRILGISHLTQLKIFKTPTLSSLIMISGVILAKSLIYLDIIGLTILVIVGILIYMIFIILLTQGEIIRDVKMIIHTATIQTRSPSLRMMYDVEKNMNLGGNMKEKQ
jgi:O-antigen/teichoic acid export membrane protein